MTGYASGSHSDSFRFETGEGQFVSSVGWYCKLPLLKAHVFYLKVIPAVDTGSPEQSTCGCPAVAAVTLSVRPDAPILTLRFLRGLSEYI